MKKVLLFFGFVFVLSCKQSEKKVDTDKIENNNGDNLEYVSGLKKRSVEEGDSNAFGELIDYYGRHPSEYHELLPIAIILADKYNNNKARIAIYTEMIMINNNGDWDDKLFFNLNQAQQDFVVSYLIAGAKNQSLGCKSILRKILKGGYQIKSDNKDIEFFLK